MTALVDLLIAFIIAFIAAHAHTIGRATMFVGVVLVLRALHGILVDRAVRAEREACAETAAALAVVERGAWSAGARWMRDRIELAIRHRGGPTPLPGALGPFVAEQRRRQHPIPRRRA